MPKIGSYKQRIFAKSGLIYAFLIFSLLFLLTVNSCVAAFLEGRIYPNIKIAGQNFGLMSRAEALSVLKAKQANFKMKINIGDKSFDYTTTDMGASYDASKTAELAYQVGRNDFALTGLIESMRNGKNGYAYNLDNQKFSQVTQSIVDSLGRPPVNATIKINDGNIEVVPAKAGLKIDPRLLRQAINDTFTSAKDQILDFKPIETPADIQASDTIDAQNRAREYMARKFSLNYNGQTFSPTPADIGHWLVFEPVQPREVTKPILGVKIDDTQIKGYVQSIANQINIQPVNKKVVVANGVKSTEREGQDGLAIDQDLVNNALINAAQANQDLSYTIPANKVAYKTEYNEVVALGYAKYIEVSLSSQHLWAYQDGQVIYSSPLTSGATGAGFPTATGLFSIYYKTMNTHLDGRPFGYNYNVFVQYWMPFYADYGLHDASWRSSFGGQDYYYGGSHGCVNLPLATAAFLYSWSEVGTPVWVHR